MTLSTRLARQSNAVVLLTWSERLPRGAGYLVHVRPWEGPFTASPEVLAAQVNAQMESLIRERPSQYLWSYARYKEPR